MDINITTSNHSQPNYSLTPPSTSTTESLMKYSSTTESLIYAQPVLTAFLLFLYGVIFCVGMFGNLMVVVVVLKYKAMQSITNRYIACLSVSDILLCLFAVPFTPINALMTSWVFGSALCKLVPVVLVISVFVSTLTSVLIAVDRYMVIVHPHFPRMQKWTQFVIIVFTWVLAASAAIPIGQYSKQKDEGNVTSCTEEWPSPLANDVYTWIILVFQVAVPGVIIIFCYSSICSNLRRRASQRIGSKIEAKIRIENKRNRRINRMLIAMITIFISCWLPLDVYHFVGIFIPEDTRMAVFLVVHIIAMSSVMYNPLLYGWMNDNFNRHFCKIIPILKHMRRRHSKQGALTTTCDPTVHVSVSRTTDVSPLSSRKDDQRVADELNEQQQPLMSAGTETNNNQSLST